MWAAVNERSVKKKQATFVTSDNAQPLLLELTFFNLFTFLFFLLFLIFLSENLMHEEGKGKTPIEGMAKACDEGERIPINERTISTFSVQ